MCHSGDDNMVVLKSVITRARVVVSGGRVLRMGPGPTNSYVDSRAKCDISKRNRRQLAMLSLKY